GRDKGRWPCNRARRRRRKSAPSHRPWPGVDAAWSTRRPSHSVRNTPGEIYTDIPHGQHGSAEFSVEKLLTGERHLVAGNKLLRIGELGVPSIAVPDDACESRPMHVLAGFNGLACLAFSAHKAAGRSVAAAGGTGGGCRDRSLFARGRRRRCIRSHCLHVMIVRRRRRALLRACNRSCG